MKVISYYFDKKNRLFEITKTEGLIQVRLIGDAESKINLIGDIIDIEEEILIIP
jgi:hypothetical protein